MLAVIALGGNALLQRNEKLSIETQGKNARLAAKSIAKISKRYKIVVTHGNGPQVGNIMIQVESALGKAYPVPLHVAVAESEGEIGYLLEQAIYNETKKPVITMLTQVLVRKTDKAFRKPTKPIGPYYSKKEAMLLMRRGYKMVKIDGGYRRVVASPRPIRIIEAPIIKKLSSIGTIAIAAGGGGIPVFKKNGLHGIDAVVDKDLASSCLAKSIGADMLVILTDVDCVYSNYKKKNQKPIRKLSIKQAKELLDNKELPEGSMGPKVMASIEFANYGGRAIITNFKSLDKALKGKAGTLVVR